MTHPREFMELPAIDVHAHCGTYPGHNVSAAKLYNAEADEVVERARSCDVRMTVFSEIGAFDAAPDRPSDVDAANARACAAVEQFDELRFYAVLNPKRPNWQAATDRLLEHPGCAGVKLHPRWHFWPVEEHGDEVFAFLSERNVLTLTHTGNAGNEPHRYIPFTDRHRGVRLILAHIGHSENGEFHDQIEAVKRSTQGNVWADTSSSKSTASRLIEQAVDELGADRVLFGSDSPLYFTPMQKARIAYAQIDDDAKRKILHDNAAKLLGEC